VSEDPRPPVAIRISRPQATEDEFLEQELDTVTRTGVTLLGAQPRPQGVVLRFEIVLASGTIVMRGEGRVVAFKPNAHQGLGGLTLRFTRLDSKSKALVDKANALRESRRPSHHPSAPPPLPDLSPGPPAVEMSRVPAIPEGPRAEISPPMPPVRVPPPPMIGPRGASRPPPPVSARPSVPNGHASADAARALPAPAGRDALLERLRARAKQFDARAIESILQQKPRG